MNGMRNRILRTEGRQGTGVKDDGREREGKSRFENLSQRPRQLSEEVGCRTSSPLEEVEDNRGRKGGVVLLMIVTL